MVFNKFRIYFEKSELVHGNVFDITLHGRYVLQNLWDFETIRARERNFSSDIGHLKSLLREAVYSFYVADGILNIAHVQNMLDIKFDYVYR